MRHSSIGPSAAARWLACPGSVRLCSALIKRPPGKAAEEGTAAHKLAELVLTGELDSPAQGRGKVMAKTPDGWDILPPELASKYASRFEVNGDMVGAVNVYVDYVRSLGGSTMVETRFDLGQSYDGLDGVFGTNDCTVSADGVLHVLDYKHGVNEPVEVEENPQLMLYALGAIGSAPGVDKVVLTIVQPRCSHRDGPIRSWETTAKALKKWAAKVVKPAIEAINDPNAPLVPGEKQCRWCEAARQAVCPAVVKNIGRATGLDLVSPIAEQHTLPAPQTMSPADRARVLLLEPVLQQWLTAVREIALEEAQRGVILPGLKLVHKITRRRWRDEAGTVAALRPILGDEMWETKLKSPSQVEKLIKGGKKAIAPLVESPIGDLTLAPESDRRNAVNPMSALSHLFDDL